MARLLGCEYFGNYQWQRQVWFILYYVSQYIVWPYEYLFVTAEGIFRIDIVWVEIITATITLIIYITLDFLLRRLVWRKIEKRKSIKPNEDSQTS